MRREQQRGLGHAAQQAGHGMAQDRRTFLAAVVEDVATLGIEQAEMHMHAVARARAVRLGHEGCGKAVLARDTLDDALEEHGVIGRLQGIVAVQEVDLELADAILGDRRIRGYILALAFGIDVGNELAEIIEFVDGENGIGIQPLAGIGRDRRHGAVGLGIDQVEFHLRRHHGAQAELLVFAHDGGEGLARIGEEGLAILQEEPERHQGARPRRPGHRQDAAPGRPADTIHVARGEHMLAVDDVLAPDVDAHDRQGHADAAPQHLLGLADRYALAAHDAVEVADHGLDALDRAVFLQQGCQGVPIDAVGRHHARSIL